MLKDLSESLQKLIESKKSCEFSFVCITIKAAIEKLNSKDTTQKKLPVIPNSRQIQDYYEYYSENFKFWINQRNKFSTVDESNFMKGCPQFLKSSKIQWSAIHYLNKLSKSLINFLTDLQFALSAGVFYWLLSVDHNCFVLLFVVLDNWLSLLIIGLKAFFYHSRIVVNSTACLPSI